MVPLEPRQVALSRLDMSLGFLLRLVQVGVFQAFYDDLGPLGLRPGEFSVLWVLSLNPGVRQGVLAERLSIKRAHMAKMVRGFEERGLVARRVPEDDRRAVELRLTKAGRAYVDDMASEFFAHDSRRPSRLTRAEQAQLIRLLRIEAGLATPGERE